MSEWNQYRVWRRQTGQCTTKWLMTSYNLIARSDKEAESKLRRSFAACGFHAMSLVAVPFGTNPNHGLGIVAKD